MRKKGEPVAILGVLVHGRPERHANVLARLGRLVLRQQLQTDIWFQSEAILQLPPIGCTQAPATGPEGLPDLGDNSTQADTVLVHG